MPNYSYEVINALGKKKVGTLEATDRDKAISTLVSTGNTVVSVKEAGLMGTNLSLGGAKKVKSRQMAAYCRQFVSIMRAGVPLIAALKMMENQTDIKVLKEATQAIRVSVEKGSPLSASMAKHDALFPALFINMVIAGEETGNLDRSFEQMAIHYEKQAKLKGMVKKAMMYPLIVCCLAVAVVIIMLVFIVPSFMEMFEGMDIDMPAYTMAVVGMSNFLIDNWYFVLAVVAVLVVAFKLFKSTDKGAHILGHLAITVPILGKLNTKTACAQFSRNLQTMLGAGIKITGALDIVSKTMDSLIYKETVIQVKQQVEVGMPLARTLEKTGMFPPMLYNMVGIGEESGATEEMLGTIADYYEEEVTEATAQATATLEPLLIIAMALICIAIIGAVFMPIITLYGSMDQL